VKYIIKVLKKLQKSMVAAFCNRLKTPFSRSENFTFSEQSKLNIHFALRTKIHFLPAQPRQKHSLI